MLLLIAEIYEDYMKVARDIAILCRWYSNCWPETGKETHCGL